MAGGGGAGGLAAVSHWPDLCTSAGQGRRVTPAVVNNRSWLAWQYFGEFFQPPPSSLQVTHDNRLCNRKGHGIMLH